MTPGGPTMMVRSGSRTKSHPGCYPRMLSRPRNPGIWPPNCSRRLGSGTSESFFLAIPWGARARARILSTFFFPHSLVTGGQVSRVDPEAMGLNPAWRKSLVYTILGTNWQDGANLTEIDAARQLLIKDMKILEGIAPESGAYLNEVRQFPSPIHNTRADLCSFCCGRVQGSGYEFNWKKSFFGVHYDKLRDIKQKYDPNSMFIVHEGIGSDEWDKDLVCSV